MKRPLFALMFGTSVALIACGGSTNNTPIGGTTPTPASPTPVGSPTPVASPTMSPTPLASPGSLPQQANVVDGSSTGLGWVTQGSSVLPLYTYSTDPPNTATCTSVGSCIQAWPAYMSTPTDVAQGNFAPCNGPGTQWCYNTHPVYTFVGDGSPQPLTPGGTITAVGNGAPVPSTTNGTFFLARPGTATPAPGRTPCPGYYC